VAKSSKSSERRARIEQLERERKAAERRRLFLFSGVIGLICLVLVGFLVYGLTRPSTADKFADVELASIGVPRSAAGCAPVQEEPASGGADHVASGDIRYSQAPPAFGAHRPTWASFDRKFYTVEDRPEVELLVHNLEHGYNILWYDETIANDPAKLRQVEGLATKFEGSEADPNKAFIAAPWTAADGGSFPQGKHLALTHWYADPQTGANEKGITQYCTRLSGEVVGDFMQQWDQSEAREGGAGFL
jgi:hypothetical protein